MCGVSSGIFMIAFWAIILNTDQTLALLKHVENNNNMEFTVFIGTKLTQAESSVSQIVREVVGIGAIVGSKYVLTTEEYMRWYNLPNIQYFVYVGSHNFDKGGQHVSIVEMKYPPQNEKSGPHTLVLLVLEYNVLAAAGTSKIFLDNQFTAAGTKIDMIGIYQRDAVKLATSEETVMANHKCGEILNVDTNTDKRYANFGSQMCMVSTNLERVDCKSHIGSIAVLRIYEGNFLIGIKSELHQSCSVVPYVLKFQRITPVHKWLKANMMD